MSDNRRQILDLLGAGKISPAEAERLLVILESDVSSTSPSSGGEIRAKPKYLRVVVETDDNHHGHGPTKVNIRVPMQLLRAGVKLTSLIPVQARIHVNEALREQGVNLDLTQLKPENLEEIIDQMNELTVDVDDPGNRVRIFCE